MSDPTPIERWTALVAEKAQEQLDAARGQIARTVVARRVLSVHRGPAAREDGIDLDEIADAWVMDKLVEDVRGLVALFTFSGMPREEAITSAGFLLKGRGEWTTDVAAAVTRFQDEGN